MNTAVLIANPAASQFTGGLHRKVSRALTKNHLLETAWPQNAEDARRIAAEAVSRGVSLIVAMGGDGIVHHVAQAVVDTPATLGIIPTGTTNVIARIHQIPKTPQLAAKLLAVDYDTRTIPTICVRAETAEGTLERHALFSMGIGLDAEVVSIAELEPHRKLRFGWFHYAGTTLKVLWKDLRKRKREFEVSCDLFRREAIGLLVQCHPVYTYFGRIPLTIDQEPPDPMSALVIERLPFRRAARFLSAARNGHLEKLQDIDLVKNCHELEATSIKRPQNIQCDGELINGVERLVAEYRPLSIRLAVPSPESVKQRLWSPRRLFPKGS